MRWFAVLAALLLTTAHAPAQTAALSTAEVVRQALEADPWGLNGAQIRASVTVTDRRGTKRRLAFVAASKQHDPPLSKSIVRFSAPPNLAGAGFLQIQQRDRDDDRFLFLPALRRSRRISGNLRANAFMGTDFSFADLDRRDLREGEARLVGTDNIGPFPCYVIDVVPQRDDSKYSRIQVWVRKDNFLTLRMKMYDHANLHIKSFAAQEVKRVSSKWFVSRSLMTNHKNYHSTLLVLEDIVVDAQIPDEEFSVRALERP